MIRSWLNLTRLAMESQTVIALRLAKLARGGPAAGVEAQRMVSEKVGAGMKAAGRLMAGASPDSVVQDYRRTVQANAKRLRRK